MGANVLIMAGGTGATCSRHWPARAVPEPWLHRSLAGDARGIENELVPNAGLPLHLINVTARQGKLSLLKAPFVLLKAVFKRAIIPCSSRSACSVWWLRDRAWRSGGETAGVCR